MDRAVRKSPKKIMEQKKITSFESITPLENGSKCCTTDRYATALAHTACSYELTQSITHSSRHTAKVTPPAMIWFRVVVEMNVPMAINAPPCNSSPRYPTRIGFQSGLP